MDYKTALAASVLGLKIKMSNSFTLKEVLGSIF